MKNSLTTLIDDDMYARFLVLQNIVRKSENEIMSNSALLGHLMSIGIDYYEKNVLSRDKELFKRYEISCKALIHNFNSLCED